MATLRAEVMSAEQRVQNTEAELAAVRGTAAKVEARAAQVSAGTCTLHCRARPRSLEWHEIRAAQPVRTDFVLGRDATCHSRTV